MTISKVKQGPDCGLSIVSPLIPAQFRCYTIVLHETVLPGSDYTSIRIDTNFSIVSEVSFEACKIISHYGYLIVTSSCSNSML